MKTNKNTLNSLTSYFGYILLAAVIFCGCESQQSDFNTKETVYSNDEMMSGLKNYTIEGCEYIGKLRGWNTDVITHKGNCKFCAERSKNNCR